MGTNKRYGTPSEREERHRRAQEERDLEEERRRPRHCWVREGDGYVPGLLVEWVPHAAGACGMRRSYGSIPRRAL